MKSIRKIQIIFLVMLLVVSAMAVPAFAWAHDGGSGYYHGGNYHNGYDRGYGRHYSYDRGHRDWDGPRHSSWYSPYYSYYGYYGPAFSIAVPGFSFYIAP